MRASEIKSRAKAIGLACRDQSVEGQRYRGFVQCYAEKGAAIALQQVSHLLPEEPLDPLDEAILSICEDYGFEADTREAQAVRVAVRRGRELADQVSA